MPSSATAIFFLKHLIIMKWNFNKYLSIHLLMCLSKNLAIIKLIKDIFIPWNVSIYQCDQIFLYSKRKANVIIYVYFQFFDLQFLNCIKCKFLFIKVIIFIKNAEFLISLQKKINRIISVSSIAVNLVTLLTTLYVQLFFGQYL